MILRNSVLFLCSCALVCAVEANAAEGHVIRGVVTTTDDTPLANAKVVLRSDETGQPEYGTLTERDGGFVLRDVSNGRYRFIVEKEGYVSWYGQQRPNGPGIILVMTETSAGRDFRIRLSRAASISGRITDENGNPVAGAQVRIYTRWKFHDQIRFNVVSAPGSYVQTNDLGEYRGYGLAAGTYYVGASYMRNIVGPSKTLRVDQSNRSDQYLPMFFPAALDPLAATAIEVGPNADARGVDFSLLQDRTVKIRGRLVGCLFQAVDAVSIDISWRLTFPGVPSLFLRQGRVLDKDGHFEITGVPRGAYRLSVLVRGQNPSWTMKSVEVGANDIDDLVIACAPRVEVHGIVRVEGNVNLGDRVLVNLRRPEGGGTGYAASIKKDRTFTIVDIPPDEYRLTVLPLPGNVYIRSIMLGSTDVLEKGVTIAGSVQDRLEIVLSDKAPAVTVLSWTTIRNQSPAL
jgi:hypothetical protein